MDVVNVVFKSFCISSEKFLEQKIKCFGWEVNENFYTFFLNKQKNKVISIPVNNVLYVEDLKDLSL